MKSGFPKSIFFSLILLSLPVFTFSQQEQTAQIIRKMVRAAQTTAYAGDWITETDTTRTWQKIYQDSTGKRFIQYILPLSLLGREIVRIPPAIYIRRKGTPKFRKRADLFQDRLFSGPSSDQQLDLLFRNYDVSLTKGRKFLGRKTRLLAFNPRTKDRAGIKVLLDQKTDLPLHIEKLSISGKIIQRSYFKNLLIGPVLDPALFTILPGQIDSARAVRCRTFTTVESLQKEVSFAIYLPRWTPDGFRLKTIRLIQFHKKNVVHFIYFDGLSTLSLFERKAKMSLRKKKPPAPGFHKGFLEYRKNRGRLRLILVGDVDSASMEKMLGLPGSKTISSESSRKIVFLVGFVVIALVIMIQFLSRKGSGRRGS